MEDGRWVAEEEKLPKNQLPTVSKLFYHKVSFKNQTRPILPCQVNSALTQRPYATRPSAKSSATFLIHQKENSCVPKLALPSTYQTMFSSSFDLAFLCHEEFFRGLDSLPKKNTHVTKNFHPPGLVLVFQFPRLAFGFAFAEKRLTKSVPSRLALPSLQSF